MFSAASKGDRLISDFLLISRLPNVFDRESYIKDEAIFLFGGAHGVGTKATDLILRDTSLLSKLTKRAGKTMYWQALFQIDGVDHFYNDPKFGVRWHPTSINDEFFFSPISFDERRLVELAQW